MIVIKDWFPLLPSVPPAYTQWMEQHGGVIVNITADIARGIPMMAHTAAARAGVENLTKVQFSIDISVSNLCTIASKITVTLAHFEA